MNSERRYHEDDWKVAKAEAYSIMAKYAKFDTPISYTEFCSQLNTIQLGPRDPETFRLLTEISEENFHILRAFLSVIVVLEGKEIPGFGFINMVERKDPPVKIKNNSQLLKYCREQRAKLCEYWKDKELPEFLGNSY